jgi:hypothetical protein
LRGQLRIKGDNMRKVSRWAKLSAAEIISVTGHKARKDKKGLFYHKGGAGIESNPLSLRRPAMYLDGDNSNNRKGVQRERGKSEIWPFEGFSKY